MRRRFTIHKTNKDFTFDNYLTIEAHEDGLTASLSVNACEYCVDGNGNWKTLSAGTATESINSGHILSFRGNLTPNSSNGIGKFTINKKCNLKGNCMSMLFGDNAADNYSLSGKDCAFYKLFYGCSNIVNISSNFLPATTLADHCYNNMFNGCTSLTTAPTLPATTLARGCYGSMFSGCTSLTTAPSILPATTLAEDCYPSMFFGCRKLTIAPALPATTLKYNCYKYMFYNCTSLNYIKCLATSISASDCTNNWVNGVASTGTFVQNPDMDKWETGVNGIPVNWTVKGHSDFSTKPLTFNILSAGTINWTASDASITKTIEYKLNNGEWTSITSNTGSSAPTITVNSGDKLQLRGNNAQYATSYSNYNSFSGSTALFEAKGNIMSLIYGDDFKNKLTISSTYAFVKLFRNCTNLVSAENLVLPATTLADYCYSNMFQNCTKLTTAPELPAMTLVYGCYSGMFNGCTSLTTVPSNLLPATTLAIGCYASIFVNCTSLTTAPELPATTLTDRCYTQMFYGCASLNYIKCLATDISAINCTSRWVSGVASTGTFVKAPSMTSWTTGIMGIPKGWTVQNA